MQTSFNPTPAIIANKPANQVKGAEGIHDPNGHASDRREETGAGATRQSARIKGQTVDAQFLQMRQNALKIENPETKAQDRLSPVHKISRTEPFFDKEFHDLLLTHISQEIGDDLNRLRGEKVQEDVEKNQIFDITSGVLKTAIGITAGIFLTPLATFAIEAGMELVSAAAKHIQSHQAKKRAGSIMTRLEDQMNNQPNSSLNTFRTLYAYAEMILLSFYDHYGDQLSQMDFAGMSTADKNKLAKAFKSAIFSSHTLNEAKKDEEKSLVTASREDVMKVFKRQGVLDPEEEAKEMQRALRRHSIA